MKQTSELQKSSDPISLQPYHCKDWPLPTAKVCQCHLLQVWPAYRGTFTSAQTSFREQFPMRWPPWPNLRNSAWTTTCFPGLRSGLSPPEGSFFKTQHLADMSILFFCMGWGKGIEGGGGGGCMAAGRVSAGGGGGKYYFQRSPFPPRIDAKAPLYQK